VTDAGCSSGTRRLRRKIPLLFGEESLKTVCFDSFISINVAEVKQELGDSFVTEGLRF
jgi:hypothetical protein